MTFVNRELILSTIEFMLWIFAIILLMINVLTDDLSYVIIAIIIMITLGIWHTLQLYKLIKEMKKNGHI